MRDRKDAGVSRNGRNEKNVVYRYTKKNPDINHGLCRSVLFGELISNSARRGFRVMNWMLN